MRAGAGLPIRADRGDTDRSESLLLLAIARALGTVSATVTTMVLHQSRIVLNFGWKKEGHVGRDWAAGQQGRQSLRADLDSNRAWLAAAFGVVAADVLLLSHRLQS